MASSAPHYLLFATCESGNQGGNWRFVLESLEGDQHMDVRDCETDVSGERLELMAVLRGLEALDQPSRVTLITPSRYVARGIRFGLDAWRQNGWHWETHGEMVPIKDSDYWQRMDQALGIHQVRMRCWSARVSAPRREPNPRHSDAVDASKNPRLRPAAMEETVTDDVPQSLIAMDTAVEPKGSRLFATVKTMVRRIRQTIDLSSNLEPRLDGRAQVA